MLPTFPKRDESPSAGQSSKLPQAASPAPVGRKPEGVNSPPAATKSEQPKSPQVLPPARKPDEAKLPKLPQGAPAARKPDEPRSPPGVPLARKPEEAKKAQTDTAAQLDELHRLEKKVAAWQAGWIAAANALMLIHKRELYRHVAPTFEQYLQERWQMKRRHGLKLITAAGVASNVKEVSDSIGLRAALELAKLPKEQQAPCLREAIAARGNRDPSATDLSAAVAKRLPPKPKKKHKARAMRTIKLKSGTIKLKAGADLKTLIAEATAQLSAQSRANAA